MFNDNNIVKIDKSFYEKYCKYCPYIVMNDICFKKNYDICIARNKQDQNKELDFIVVIENGRRVFKK